MNLTVPRFAMILLFFHVLSSPAIAGRDIPDDNLSLAVLVTLDSGEQASGFYLDDTNYYYLVTARHVLFDPGTQALKSKTAMLLSYSKDVKDPKRIKLKINLENLQKDGLIRKHQTADVAVARIGKSQKTPDGEGQIVTTGNYVEWIEGMNAAAILASSISGMTRFDEVLTGNEVYLFGYPGSIGIKEIPQIEYERPLLRKGIVAGKNQSKKTIILDCTTYFGNSGGPVAQAEIIGLGNTAFRIIGIVSEFIPFTETWINATHKMSSHWQISNSGYSVIVPIDRVLEVLEPEPTPDPLLIDLKNKIEQGLSKLDPKPSFEIPESSAGRSLVVRYKTRQYVVHPKDKAGLISVTSETQEGPSDDGILLRAHILLRAS